MVIFDAPLCWSEAIRHKMWNLIYKVKSSLYRVEKLRNSTKKNNKRQSKESMILFHSKHCSYAFVYVYMLVQFYL